MKKQIVLCAMYRMAFLVSCLWGVLPEKAIAVVHMGIDTIMVDQGLDFSAPDKEGRVFARLDQRDFVILQRTDIEGSVAYEPKINSHTKIRDLGLMSLSSLQVVPDDLEPDPETAQYHLVTGELIGWAVPMLKGHLYVVWTLEGRFAKMVVEDIITLAEMYPKTHQGLDEFVGLVVLRWAYQDDGSRSFSGETLVGEKSWAEIKHLFKREELRE